MSEEEQIEKIKKIRNKSIIFIMFVDVLMLIIIYLLGSSSNSGGGCYSSGMSQQEKDIHNAKVQPYIGDTIKGSEVISMLETIISMNQENIDIKGKFISVQVEDINNFDKEAEERLDKTCKICNYYDGDKNNNEENVKNATEEIINLKRKINSSKKYKVEAEDNEGVIYKIKISKKDEEKTNKKVKKND